MRPDLRIRSFFAQPLTLQTAAPRFFLSPPTLSFRPDGFPSLPDGFAQKTALRLGEHPSGHEHFQDGKRELSRYTSVSRYETGKRAGITRRDLRHAVQQSAKHVEPQSGDHALLAQTAQKNGQPESRRSREKNREIFVSHHTISLCRSRVRFALAEEKSTAFAPLSAALRKQTVFCSFIPGYMV